MQTTCNSAPVRVVANRTRMGDNQLAAKAREYSWLPGFHIVKIEPLGSGLTISDWQHVGSQPDAIPAGWHAVVEVK